MKRVADYLAELIGCEVKVLAHLRKEDEQLPLAIASCYSFGDVEFMDTRVTIARPTEQDTITPMQLAKHQAKMTEAFHRSVTL